MFIYDYVCINEILGELLSKLRTTKYNISHIKMRMTIALHMIDLIL